jgi:hypothetical protein
MKQKFLQTHYSVKHLYVEDIYEAKISSKSISIVIKYANVLYICPNCTNHHISWYLKDLLESFWSLFFSLSL